MGKSLLLLGIGFAAIFASAAAVPSCADVLNVDDTTEDGQKKMFLCQLHESAALLTQLSELVTEGVQGLLDASDDILHGFYKVWDCPPQNGAGIKPDPELGAQLEKRKHEYLRFGKRKHEYLRFGKRKHEYLRFGKRKHEYLRFGKK